MTVKTGLIIINHLKSPKELYLRSRRSPSSASGSFITCSKICAGVKTE